jgi:hypothetical protein
VIENRVLRKIFGYKRDEVIGGWRELCTEELCDFYSSPGRVAHMEEKRCVHV